VLCCGATTERAALASGPVLFPSQERVRDPMSASASTIIVGDKNV